jgi:outer membrane protein assembly factor BamB
MHEAVLDREMPNAGHRLGRFGGGRLQAPRGTRPVITAAWIANRIGRSGISHGDHDRQEATGMRRFYLVSTLSLVLAACSASPNTSSSPDGAPSFTVAEASTAGAPGSPGSGFGADVPTYRGNAARTGMMPGPGPIADARLDWKLTTDGPIHSAPVIAGGMVYLAAESGSLYAIDLATGRQRWLAHASTSQLSTPDVVGGAVLVGTADGLQALDSKTGEQRWSVDTDGPVSGAPADANGMVAVATGAGTVVLVEATTGAVRWKADAGAPVESSPAIGGGIVVVGTNDGSILALALADGTILWKTDTGDTGRVGTPAIASGRVFASTGLDADGPPSHHIVALDAASGLILWRYASPTGAAVYTPAVNGGQAFVTSEDGSVVALDVTTGAVVWTAPVDGPVEIVAAIAGTAVYAASNGGSAFAIDAATGSELWRIPIRGVPYGPTVAGGRLLVGTNVGELAAIGGTLP